ncbi:MAG: sulfatase/phosphatase domain-containing protein, partial [Actinomycetota bacterium]|nr:sulfatase/phosphatase domain-containing protein [Actinomycetota bacterium]
AARQQQRDTLVIYLSGDNGASAEGTIHGAWSAPSFQNGVHEDPEWLLEHIDDFGTAKCENHFNVGWAWALDSPFQWMKQVASHFGGTRNGLAIEWPDKITENGGLRSQFHHVVDIAPTILEAAGITMPESVNGIKQMPVHGVPMGYSFAENGPSQRTTQYFEILGNRAIYNDGWIASCFHGRVPWIRMQAFEFDGPQEQWELYDIKNDFSQSVDLADEYPELLEGLLDLFDSEAKRFGVYPLRDAGSRRGGELGVPHALGGLRTMTYTTAHVRMPESVVVRLKNCSWKITAEVETTKNDSGVIACQGGNMSGWSLWLSDGTPNFTYNCYGHEITTLTGNALKPGIHQIEAVFDYDGGFGKGGELVLIVDKMALAHERLERTVPIGFSMSGETFDVGTDTGSPVGPYPHDFQCTATIVGVTLTRLSEPGLAVEAAEREGLLKAGFSTQ